MKKGLLRQPFSRYISSIATTRPKTKREHYD
ncbi:hypothetical protein VPHD482_0069 [Vibrio phage D482]